MSEWQETDFGRVPSNWDYEPLENFFDLITYGFTNPMPTTSEGPYMLTAKDIYDGKIQYDSARRTSNEAYEELLTNKSRPLIDDILITKDGSIGRVAIVDKSNICISQSVALIRPNKRIIPLYLKYLLEAKQYQKLIDIDATGSTIQHIYITKINKMRIGVPEIKIQEGIVECIHSIQSKIDLLHRQNKTLEQLAETLFRQWFVEEVEKGWAEMTVNSIAKIQSGYAFKSADFIELGTFKIITIKSVQDGFLDTDRADMINGIPNGMPEYCLLNEGDILLSLTGNVGRCCLVDENNLLLNQRVAKLKPIFSRDWAFIYIMFRQTSMRRILEELAKGTAQANLSPIETGQMAIHLPPTERLERFSIEATPLIQKILQNKKQIRTLSQMRDTLLPKLMSGDVKIKI